MVKEGLGLEITELRLGLPNFVDKKEKKRVFSEFDGEKIGSNGSSDDDDSKQKTKNQVVGWPPVCSYRRKNSFNGREAKKMYIKVSLDGAPILRKIDLSTHKAYADLIIALEKLFGCFGIGEALEDAESNSEYVPIYEDKDGDWMLLGDVPWEMFIETCKKLRIMKRSDAKGMGVQTKDFLKGIIKEGSL